MKFKQRKHFEIDRDDGHLTYVQIFDNGDFMIGELYKDPTEEEYQYHAVLSVRSNEVSKILEILNDEENWKFKPLVEVDDE